MKVRTKEARLRSARRQASRIRLGYYADPFVVNVFCPTGPGGGVDPHCSPSGKDIGARFRDHKEAEAYITSRKLAGVADLTGMSGSEASAVVESLESSMTVAGVNLTLRAIRVVDQMPVDGETGGLGYSNGNIYIAKGFLGEARANDREAVRRQLQGTGGERNYGWQDGSSSAESIKIAVAHEVGHHVNDSLLLDLQKAVRVVRNAGISLGEAEMVKVSGYASTHVNELFAETHSFISTGRSHLVPESVQSFYKNAVATADPDPLFVRNRLAVNRRRLTANARTRRQGKTLPSPTRVDPTRTGTLRRAFAVKLRRRFALLKGRLVQLVIDEDAFGLKDTRVSMADLMKPPKMPKLILANVFCPTGKGGGVDPSCSPGGDGEGGNSLPVDYGSGDTGASPRFKGVVTAGIGKINPAFLADSGASVLVVREVTSEMEAKGVSRNTRAYADGPQIVLIESNMRGLSDDDVAHTLAHEIGHKWESKYGLSAGDDEYMWARISDVSKLSVADKQKWKYVATHEPEPLVEAIAQAVNPNPKTAWGIKTSEFEAAFPASVAFARKKLAEKGVTTNVERVQSGNGKLEVLLGNKAARGSGGGLRPRHGGLGYLELQGEVRQSGEGRITGCDLWQLDSPQVNDTAWHPLTQNAFDPNQPRDPEGRFAPVGGTAFMTESGPLDISPLADVAAQALAHAQQIQKAGVLHKLGAPGKWMKQKTAALYQKLESRYGRKQAIAIMASGQVLAWGATAAGAAMGVPIWLPGSSLWGAAPAAAIAEVYLQASRHLGKGRKPAAVPAANRVRLTPEEIERLGREFLAEVEALAVEARRQFGEGPAANADGGPNCGTGAGGFKPGNTCAAGSGGMPDKAALRRAWKEEDKQIEKARRREHLKLERQFEAEDRVREKVYRKEDAAKEKDRDRQDRAFEDSQDKEERRVEKQREAEDDVSAAEYGRRLKQIDRETQPGSPERARRDKELEEWENKATDEQAARRQREDDLRHKRHDEAFREYLAIRQQERDKEDKQIAERREREEAESTARWSRAEDALNDRWEQEDEVIYERRRKSSKPPGPAANAGNPTVNTRWKFHSSPAKLQAFQDWLRTQIGQTLTSLTDEGLWQAYVEAGFRKGAGRAFDDVRRRERAVSREPADFQRGSREEFLRSSFGQPVAVEKVKLLASRAFDDLENVTADMSTKMSRLLVDGLTQGKGPHDVARDLVKQLDISWERAELIAKSELIRAHADGQLLALEQLGVEEVGVAVEWAVTKVGGKPDAKVCPRCRPMDGVVLKIAEARGLIPRHPG